MTLVRWRKARPLAALFAAAVLMAGCATDTSKQGDEQRTRQNGDARTQSRPGDAAERDLAGTRSPPRVTPSRLPAASQPAWQSGDRWVWSDGYGLQVARTDGRRTRFTRTDVDGQWVEREAIFAVSSQSASTLREVVFRTKNPIELFPLEVGKGVVFEREYLANGKLRRHRVSWIVEGVSSVEVPAGTFDTWVLVRRARSVLTDWTSYERWWYSPQAKNYVRMEYQYGKQPAGSRVLVRYLVNQ